MNTNLITPDDLTRLADYMRNLYEPGFRSQEIKVNHPNPSALETARALLRFFDENKEVGNVDANYRLEPILKNSHNDHDLVILLNGHADVFENLIREYHKHLEGNMMHGILSKKVTDMTGYDVQRLVSYFLQRIRDDNQLLR